MRFLTTFFGLLLFFSLAALVASGPESSIYVSGFVEDDFWKGRKIAEAASDNPTLPIQFPGPADLWAGGEKKTIVVALSATTETTVALTLFDAHNSAPPLIEVRAGDRLVTKLAIEPGHGQPPARQKREGKKQQFVFTIPGDALASLKTPSLTFTTVSGSWVALDTLTLHPSAPVWALWQKTPQPVAWVLLVISLGGIGWRVGAPFFRPEGREKRIKYALFTFITVVVIPSLFLGAIEGSLRILDIADPDREEDPYVGFKSYVPVFIDSEQAADKLIFNQRRGRSPQVIDKVKKKNGYRVAFFGGSNVFKLTPQLHLFEKRIEEKIPGVDVEAINFGLPAYGAHRIVPLFDEALTLDLDLIIVYSGHNEFLEKRFFAAILNEAEWLTAVKLTLQRLRLYTLMRRLFREMKQKTVGMHTDEHMKEHETGRVTLGYNVRTDHASHTDRRYQRVVLRQYEQNLMRMAAKAKAASVPMVIATLASPDLQKPRSPCLDPALGPEKMVKTRALTTKIEEMVRESHELVGRAYGKQESFKSVAGLLAQIAPLLDEAEKIAPADGDVLFWRGFVAYFEGDFVKAKELMRKGVTLDCAPWRATDLSNAIVRRVAEEYGLPLIDADSYIEERSPYGVSFVDLATLTDEYHGGPFEREPLRPSYDPTATKGLFFDHCHLNYDGKVHLLSLFADTIVEKGWLPLKK